MEFWSFLFTREDEPHGISIDPSDVRNLASSSHCEVNLDMNQITCRDWLGYEPAAQSFVRFWMSGYYNAAANSNVLDYNRLQKNSAKVVAYCKTHRSQTLPTVIKNAAS
ncbi:MAG: HdeA/HdeB family chaperone [Pseudolabrys sp.]